MGNVDIYMVASYRPCDEVITDVLKNGSEDGYVFVAPEVID